ncbi:MAG TPA: glycosyltransferase family 4 protein [Actinomycetota bacterium]|nr:glycosyltransferase family 4 protein [Actinomycetota bacterium]
MRLLMTTDCVGGVWTYSLELVRALQASGHEVVVAAMGGTPTQAQRSEVDAARPHAFEARPYRVEWMQDAWADVDAAGAWLLELASGHDVDLVHLNGYAHATLPWTRPTLVVAHSDVVTWWRAVKRADPPATWNRYRTIVADGLAAADVVVTPTRAMLDELARAYGRPRPSLVIHNGRSWEPRSDAAKEPVVAAVGRVWDEAKNIAIAAQAAHDLPWPLLVAGDGQIAGATCLGRIPTNEVAQLFGRASIFVEPARYEPFGLAALEAGLAGCALVLGDIPSLREVWNDAATFVAPDDTEALAAVLRDLIDDPNRLAHLQRAARERAARYSVGAMASAYEDIYRQMLGVPVSIGAAE